MLTEKEKQDVKNIIKVTVRSFADTITANFKFSDDSKQLIETIANKEIEWG